VFVKHVELSCVLCIAGATGQYLQAVMVLSFLASITQLSFQIVLFSMPPYGNFLKESSKYFYRLIRMSNSSEGLHKCT
jgi:hypothetical protein